MQKTAISKSNVIAIRVWATILLLFPLHVTSSNDNPEKQPGDTAEVNVLFKLVMDLRKKDSVTASACARQMLVISEKLKYTKGEAKAYYAMGRIAHDQNAHEPAVNLLKKGVVLYEKAHDQNGVMDCYYWIARCFRRIADYPNYQKYLALLEEKATKYKHERYLSYAFEGYGNLFRYLGDYPQSINYYVKSIELSEKLGYLEDVSGALNNMSLVYDYQEKPKEVLKIQLRNYEILQKLNKKSDLVLCLSNLSNTYESLGEKEKSSEYITRAIKIIEEEGEENIAFKDAAAAYGRFADLVTAKGQYKKGLGYYGKDVLLRQKHKDIKGLMDCYSNLAYVHRLMGNNDLAGEYLNKQLVTARDIGYVNGRLKACKSLAVLAAKQGDYKTAYSYQEECLLIKDSLEIGTTSKEMAKVDALFKVRDQQQQIELLSKDKEMRELELKKRKAITLVFAGGFFLILLTTIMLFANYRKLKRTENQLQLVNQDLESFSYSVSHDLRAPLRAIGSFAKIIEDDYAQNMDAEGNKLLNMVQHNVKKMSNLINDLLTFSKLGKKEPDKTSLNMKELFEAAMQEQSKQVKHKAKVYIGELHPAKGDHNLINQVVVNLLSNAIKYSSKIQEPLVEVSSEKNTNEVIYIVKDNGAGFDMQYAKKLFGAFQRLHSSDEFEGTGVGLAIVQRIIHKHGGKVWAEGEKDKGATFWFTLPLN